MYLEQAEGGGIFDVLSDGEDCWMAEPSGLSADDPSLQERGRWGDELADTARDLSPEVLGPARWACCAA